MKTDVTRHIDRPAVRLPSHAPGMRIGLLGGSFNPPHRGHRAMSLLAMKRLGLDRVWWLVSPGNPLKDPHALAPLGERIRTARAIANHPRIEVTGVEAAIGTRFTVDTLRWLRRHAGDVRFVWLMGADNLANFHLWRDWRAIAGIVPIAAVDRTGATRAAASPVAHWLRRHHLPQRSARSLADSKPPAFVLLHGLKCPASSTELRARAVETARAR
jgi:nicotinate-nucleotide adenylyltransferase